MDAMTDTRIVSANTSLGPIRLLNAGLDERGAEIVAHGWLDIDSINQLKVGPYQREVLAKVGGRKTALIGAVEDGARLPDIMLGMRGQSFDTKGHTMTLQDPVFVVDGLQRISALKAYADAYPVQAKTLRIGAEVRFGTTEATEEALFMVLNTSRIPVSPNVILRNLRTKYPAILTLHGLSTTDKDYPFYGRVQWGQRMARGDLVTALMLAKTSHILHSFDSRWRAGRPMQMAAALDENAKEVGLANFRKNVKTFAEMVDDCWSIRKVEYRESATHVKGNFLFCLARLLCEHSNFWKPGTNLLTVDTPQRKKIASFAIFDPDVARLASSGTMAMELLYDRIVSHFDKKMRVGRLVKRTDNR